jgi:uncharacterized metal-binding protein YceD (DUF177 family)
LAERFGLLELPSLRAELTVNPTRAGKAYAVEGKLTADAVQKCVVTLEPLPAHIEHDIAALYTMGESGEPHDGLIDPDEAEVEPVIEGVIDLGELVAQHLGIALDPYPRKPGVEFQEPIGTAEKAASNPFAKLAELKKHE